MKVEKIFIYNPSNKTGGTGNLLARLCLLLAFEKDRFQINYIDYKNSPVKSFILKNLSGQIINFIDLAEGKIVISEGICVSTLLSIKTIEENVEMSNKVRLFLWSTHPDDAQKILSSFNFWLRAPIKIKNILSKIFHPIFKNQIRDFLRLGIDKNGLFWMDKVNLEANNQFYKLKRVNNILPIFTNEGKSEIHLMRIDKTNLKEIKLLHLGRLTDFKVYPLFGLLQQISEINTTLFNDYKISIHFIGDGPLKPIIQNWLNELEIYDFKFFGHLDLNELDLVLTDYDIVFGMGTSVLESAKLKIPTVVVDASYKIVNKSQLKLKWLFDYEPFEISRFQDEGNDGLTLLEILKVFKKNQNEVSRMSYEHWKKYHSPESVKSLVIKAIETNNFYFDDQVKNLLKKDYSSFIIDFFKRFFKK